MVDPPLGYLLDRMAISDLARDWRDRRLMHTLTERGRLRLMVISAQLEELFDCPDRLTIELSLDVPFELIPAAAAPLGRVLPDGKSVKRPARLNYVRLASAQTVDLYRTAMGKAHPGNNSPDVQLLVTAAHEDVPVVTRDDKFARRCERTGVTTITPADLLTSLRARRRRRTEAAPISA
jgi:hypothetical protein